MRRPEPGNRRRLARLAGSPVLLVCLASVGWAACRPAPDDEARPHGDAGGAEASGDAPRSTEGNADVGPAAPGFRPVTLPGGGVALLDTEAGRPAAYVSRDEGTVWVDRTWRDRAHFLLGAYTSVSTGVWRLPLPGDDPRAPIAPGDERREFVVADLADRDPARPAPGDMRIRPGRRVERDVRASCLPLSDGGGWVRAGPWTVARFDGAGASVEGDASGQASSTDRTGAAPRSAGREVLARLGAGTRHAGPTCQGSGVAVDVFGWRAEAIR